jgi:hypothetical protein
MKKVNLILLILFITIALITNYLPHLNYSFPIHVDEYVHYQYSNHFSNNAPLYFGQDNKSLEAGFHYLLATLNSLGVPYLFMFNFFASLVTLIICLCVFITTRKLFSERAGIYSIVFIILLKSSASILGPSLFVPMAIGMSFIPLMIYLIQINSKAWMILFPAILIIHPPTAMAILLLINIQFIYLKKNYFNNLISMIIAGLFALPLYLPTFLSKGIDSVNSLSFASIIDPLYIPFFLGWVVIIITLAGFYVIFERKNYLLFYFSLVLLLVAVLFYWFEIHFFIMYERSLMYLFTIFAMVFGVGLSKIINFSKNIKIKTIIIIIITLLIIIYPLKSKIDSNKYFYHVINEEDYKAFRFIKDNTEKEKIAVSHPWLANALTPIAEREVYTRITQGPSKKYDERNMIVYEFFKNGCKDNYFLLTNNISIIYGNCNNTMLKEIYKNVYITDF